MLKKLIKDKAITAKKSLDEYPLNNKEIKYSIIASLYFIILIIFLTFSDQKNINPLNLYKIDLTQVAYTQLIFLFFLLGLGAYMAIREFQLFNYIFPVFNKLKKVTPYLSVILILFYYPMVDTKISTIVHESADFFTYARYHLVLYYVIYSIFSVFLVVFTIVPFIFLQKFVYNVHSFFGDMKLSDYVNCLRTLFYTAITFSAAYILLSILISLYISGHKDSFLKSVIVSTSFGPNTVCLDDSAQLFRGNINYLDRSRVSIVTQTLNAKGERSYKFVVQKCER